VKPKQKHKKIQTKKEKLNLTKDYKKTYEVLKHIIMRVVG